MANIQGSIPILEEFYSIQGEGHNTGKPAYFIRVGGCDLACHWCDSKESWFPEEHKYIKIEEILQRVKSTVADTIVVTGGEPLIYNFDEFCHKAKKLGYKLMLETCGAYQFSGLWDWVCLSPKKQKPPLDIYFQIANEVKVVIFEEDDFLWAETCANKSKKSSELFLQPEWSRIKKTAEMVVDYVKNNPKWKISLQVHKYLNIP
ncbi:MAG TPA: 7-carboxy-7-deazaguanine synthase QueE [Bacteroidales bacterium]|jgi:organic radical activating enzyme|nr:7-carboxy-7-deazaguanine synthase QueE [Bacteroidales bacterium]HOL97529.1 7-carboxy-7-deazaguanine synthase QueE [Bacteroidales bacterium]HOM35797.1 7-carboxy-7-deazaguanine synthase QueE [Bacteroidales bacterium]HPD22985.1 7-carboxy-7-deazaguanine synthase QueE [Bacteroidales bacterium]HRS98824.1 7-carboxy-7-deazaguanine synthase QueE [Bacteroidales bacterium]